MGADEEERRRRHLNRCRYLQRPVPKPLHQIAYEIRLHQIAWDCMPKPLHQIACEDEAFHARRRAAITIVYRFMCVNAWSTAGATRGGTSPRKERRLQACWSPRNNHIIHELFVAASVWRHGVCGVRSGTCACQ